MRRKPERRFLEGWGSRNTGPSQAPVFRESSVGEHPYVAETPGCPEGPLQIYSSTVCRSFCLPPFDAPPQVGQNSDMGKFSALRILRVLRVVRMIRLLKVFKELLLFFESTF